MRTALTLWLLSFVIGAGRSAHALTTYRLGLGLQGGYNSQILQPTLGTSGGGAFTLVATPFFNLQAETGRVTETLQLTGLFNGSVLVEDVLGPQVAGQPCATPGPGTSCLVNRAGTFLPSWQIAGNTTTKIDLTARLQWTLLIGGSIGETNSFTLALNPAAVDVTGVNTQVTQFASVNGGWLLQWDPTARWKLSQTVNLRAFIPISTTTATSAGPSAAGVSLQSYNVDAGLALDHEWSRFTLGGDVRVGWFLPSQVPGAMNPDQSVVTGQAVARTKIDLTPRLQADGNVGAFVATQAAHFLSGSFPQLDAAGMQQVDTNGVPIRVTPTVVSPVGGAGVRYIFAGIGLGLGLSYAYAVGGEVFLGRLSTSHAVTLRGTMPLPRDIVLSVGGGYRRADLLNPDFSSAPGLKYDYALADVGLAWHVRDGVNLIARYEFAYQKTRYDVTPGTSAIDPFPDFGRHIVLVGVSLFYPPK